ncbi:MAG: HAD-IA family hydrolase [Sinobacterium sp.]|nr:HAD-IA family hydrolase [Sinobacterium sp.]
MQATHTVKSDPTKPAVLFDLDGTLVDTSADFIVVINTLCQRHGISAPADKAIRNTVSDGARALVELTFSIKEGEEGFEVLRQELLDLYEAELGTAAYLFDGFESLLKQYKCNGQPWGIVTNKPWRFTEPLIKRIFSQLPDIYPNSIICPDHVAISKPDPEGLLLACEQMQTTPANTWYVGDHKRDIDAGRNANMVTVACAYGYIKQDDDIHNWNADYLVNNVAEIFALTT